MGYGHSFQDDSCAMAMKDVAVRSTRRIKFNFTQNYCLSNEARSDIRNAARNSSCDVSLGVGDFDEDEPGWVAVRKGGESDRTRYLETGDLGPHDSKLKCGKTGNG